MLGSSCLLLSALFTGAVGGGPWSRGRGRSYKRIGNSTMQLPFEIKVSRHKARSQQPGHSACKCVCVMKWAVKVSPLVGNFLFCFQK